MLKLSLSLTILSLSCLASLHAGPVYDIKLIARTGSVIGGKTLQQVGFYSALNDRSEVVFSATFDGGSGIFDRSGLLVRSGQDVGGKMVSDLDAPWINNNGELVFAAAFDGGYGVFSLSGMIAGTGSIIGSTILRAAGFPAINDNGLVAFQGYVGTDNGIFTEHEVVALPGLTVNGITFTHIHQLFSLNNAGQIAFVGGNSFDEAAVVGSRGVAQTGQLVDGKRLSGFSRVEINNRGDIVFDTFYDFPASGIFTPNAFLGEGISPAINDVGGIVFVCDDFHAICSLEGEIVHGGSVVDGVPIASAFPHEINNLGQVLFRAELAEGGSALFLATPTPEPATCILVGFGLIVAASTKINAERRHRHDGHSRT